MNFSKNIHFNYSRFWIFGSDSYMILARYLSQVLNRFMFHKMASKPSVPRLRLKPTEHYYLHFRVRNLSQNHESQSSVDTWGFSNQIQENKQMYFVQHYRLHVVHERRLFWAFINLSISFVSTSWKACLLKELVENAITFVE